MRRTRTVLAGLAAGVLSAGGGIAASGAAAPNGSQAAGSGSAAPKSSAEFWENYNRSLQEVAKAAGPAKKLKKRDRADLLPSAKAHRGRGSVGEARKLTRLIAPQLVTDGAVVPDSSDVKQVLSPTLVQMKGKDGQSGGVMTSNLPMGTRDGTKNGAPTYDLSDIAWTTQGDRFAVKDPVVAVSVPQEAGGTVDIGKDISLRLTDADRTATGTPEGEAVTYPSISKDTDMVVRSLPTGVQVGWLLRSPDADQQFRVPIDLKDGQQLRKSPNGSVQILGADDMVVGEVATVSAGDADHVAVPVTTTVKNDTIVYDIDHAAGEVEYPIVVDPQIADVHWDTGADTTQNTADGWFGQNTPRPNEPYSYGRNIKSGTQRGQLSILGNQQAGYSQTASAAWGRFAPGDQTVGGSQNAAGRRLSDEHGYWYRFDAGALAFAVYPNKPEHNYNYPQSVVAFTDRNGNTDQRAKWAFLDANGNPGATNSGVMFGKLPNNTTSQSAAIWLGDSIGDNARLGNGRGSNDNLILFGLSPIPPYYYWQYEHPYSAIGMGWYKAYASDTAPPKVAPTAASTPSGAWQDAPPTTVSFSASDAGLGVKAVRLETTSSTASTPTALAATQNNACDRPDANTFCRFTQTGSFNGTAIPDGRGTARLVAVDGDDLDSTQTFVAASGSTQASYQSNPTTGTLNYAIDTTDPDLSLSGDLFTQRATAIPTGQTRALNVSTADGVPNGTASQQQSGVAEIKIYVDGTLVSTTTQANTGDSRGLNATWPAPGTADSATTGAGRHVVRVETRDLVNHVKVAEFEVNRQAPADTAPPTPVLTGDASGALDDYLTTGQIYNTSIDASDESNDATENATGVASMSFSIDGLSRGTFPVDCSTGTSQTECPSDAGIDTTFDPGSLTEGRHTLQAHATDGAGNIGDVEAGTVFVDRTAPTPNSALAAYRDPATGSTMVQWTGDDDADLPDGTPGAGIEKWTSRYRVNTGAWSTPVTSADPNISLTNANVGDSIDVEVRSVDASGNSSAAASLTATVKPTDPPAAAATARAAGGPPTGCGGDFNTPDDTSYRKVFLENSFAGETQITIRAQASITCRPADPKDPDSVLSYRQGRDSAQLCLQYDEGNGWQTAACTKTIAIPHSGIGTNKKLAAHDLCRAGKQKYRVQIHLISTVPSKPGSKTEAYVRDSEDSLECNESGAWRRVAARSSGSSSAELGRLLPTGVPYPGLDPISIDADPIPPHGTASPQRGWEAHHVIPSGSRRAAFGRAQAYGYACLVYPNGARNGLWLRGRYLKNDRTGYRALSTAERRRAAHSQTFADAYGNWISGRLRQYINDDGTCNNRGGMINELRAIKDDLKVGTIH